MKKYLIGNIKMNLSYSELDLYFDQLVEIAKNSEHVVGVSVPSVYLDLAKYKLENTNVMYGAQNIYFEDSGTFTGEISAHMINDFNCDFCLVGHSERRAMFGETDEWTNKKIMKLIECNIMPILCFGENLEERKNGKTHDVIKRQIDSALTDLVYEDLSKIIFAYEPVWAISKGSGSQDVSATPEGAEEDLKFIKEYLKDKYGLDKAITLYGGSMKPSNCEALLSKPSIDGGLIGGACLKMEDFEQIINTKVE